MESPYQIVAFIIILIFLSISYHPSSKSGDSIFSISLEIRPILTGPTATLSVQPPVFCHPMMPKLPCSLLDPTFVLPILSSLLLAFWLNSVHVNFRLGPNFSISSNGQKALCSPSTNAVSSSGPVVSAPQADPTSAPRCVNISAHLQGSLR